MVRRPIALDRPCVLGSGYKRHVLFVALGVALVLVGLADVFLTVLNYDGISFLAGRLYRVTWTAVRKAADLLPEQAARLVLSVTAPALLPATVLMWMSLEIVGFALIYQPAIEAGMFHTGPGLSDESLTTALYLSGVTIATLGYGDVTATEPMLQFLTVVESLTGFAILTLTISYVLSTFRVLERLRMLSDTVRHVMPDPDQPLQIIRSVIRTGDASALRHLLERIHDGLQAYDEGLRLHPVVYYFHTRETRRSAPYLLGAVSEIVGALRYGAGASHPLSGDPWVRALAEQYDATWSRLVRSFLRYDPAEGAEVQPLPPARFHAVAQGVAQGGDVAVTQFLEMESTMTGAVDGRLTGHEDAKNRYDRYCEWLRYSAQQRRFLKALVRDLGYRKAMLPHQTLVGLRAGD